MAKIYIVYYIDFDGIENQKAFSNKIEQEKFYQKALKSDITKSYKDLISKRERNLPISKKGLLYALTSQNNDID
tara:strand:- start:856 stop:1077 length:222 start_codon:yes stop_codon:yes gene_type:complete